jgi:hypothetical protein
MLSEKLKPIYALGPPFYRSLTLKWHPSGFHVPIPTNTCHMKMFRQSQKQKTVPVMKLHGMKVKQHATLDNNINNSAKSMLVSQDE